MGLLMEKTLLHLSHTDIRKDARILKELHSLQIFSEFKLFAIGLKLNEEKNLGEKDLKAKIYSINLLTKLFRFLPRPIRYLLNFIELTLVFTIRGLMLRPAVVHCHDTLVLPAGCLIKILCRSKLVYDAHELESEKNSQNLLLSKSTLLIEKVCWNKIDLLVSVSQSILSWYTENLGYKQQALVLNSPIFESSNERLNEKKDDNRYFHQLYNIANEKLVFIYVGVLAQGRGIDMYLSAFADSTIDAHIVFLGHGHMSSTIESYSNEYSNIHLHPSVPHNNVVSLVKSADVGLCIIENTSLSYYYCLPNKLFEYCFSGIPVLASNFPELKRVIDEYQVGLCCEPESQSILKALQFLCNNPLPTVSGDISDLSWSTQAQRIQQSYRSLLKID